jgi:hypothetical protein
MPLTRPSTTFPASVDSPGSLPKRANHTSSHRCPWEARDPEGGAAGAGPKDRSEAQPGVARPRPAKTATSRKRPAATAAVGAPEL